MNVRRIRQSPEGYLWMATGVGLVRSDGVRFTSFKAGSTEGLKSNSLQDMVIDPDGSMWIAALGGGLTYYQAGKFHNFTVKDGLPSDDVGSLYRDSAGTLWVGTGAGVVRMVNGRFEKPPVPIPSIITAFLEDRDHALWMATLGAGVFRLRSGILTSFTVNDGVPDNRVMSLYLDHSGRIWTAGWKGISFWNGSRFAADPVVSAVLSGSEVRSCAEDRDGNLWIASSSGLFRARGNEVTSMNRSTGLSSDYAYSIFEDGEGDIWVGTRGGLDRFRDSQIRLFRQPEGPVVTDNSGVWTASNRQITRIADNTIRSWPLSLPRGNTPITLLSKPDDSFLIGFDDGVASRTSEHTNFVSRLAALDVRSLFRAHDGSIWIGTANRGLLRWVSAAGSETLIDTGVHDRFIGTLAQDRTGAIWAGSYLGGGLYRLSDGKVQHFGREEGLPDLQVQTVLVDGTGQLWIGSTDGLSWFQDGRIRTVKSQDGLPADHIWAILDDAYDRLWFASFAGFSVIDKKSLTDWAAGKRRNLAPILDPSAGGLQTNTAGNFFPNCARTPDGHLWFSTADGLVEVTPTDPAIQQGPALHVLNEDVTIDGAVFSGGGPIRIPAGARSIEIRYTALGLADPLSARFRYCLEGIDGGWIYADARRLAFYNNLKPGSYTFRVEASIGEEQWRASAALVLEQLPFFYQTWLFKVLACVAVFLSLYAAYSYRVAQMVRQFEVRLEERASERTRLARDLHDTLLQSFQGLIFRLQAIDDLLPAGKAKDLLDKSLERADQAISEGRSAVYELRSSATTTNDLAEAIKALAEELATEESAAFQVLVVGSSRELQPIVRDEVYRITCEGLRNAFSHAQASQIEAEITYSERLFRLRIRDNGEGIPTSLLKEGRQGHYGLPGIRERASQIGGKLEIWSRAGAGTEIELSIASAIAYGASPGRSLFSLFRRKAV